ncbi:FtsX-like permease family protein [Pseudonocardia cypriaca]|uniref:Putative ABC transport system permease protein n=1 Tax=Pseudonocardia cypriaca TaxID=882449 RepID=A0A543FXI3_9PSEU|nr:FtsX-like permease family protein [Pseudonocardia cypriaca]TQM38547.1 putative ABC transport system permease protein [Pseudonocardia cypriaca]
MTASASAVLLAETRRKPGRVLLTGLAIIVATVFAAGTMLFSETLRDYLTAGDVVTPTGAAVVVHPQELPTLDGPEAAADLVGQVASLDGVATAVGVWDGSVAAAVNGTSTEWRVTSDPMTGQLSRLDTPVRGSLPDGPGELAISEETAEQTGLAPGGTVTIPEHSEEPARTLTITAVVDVPTSVDGNVMIALPTEVRRLGGWLEQIDVAAASRTAETELVGRVGNLVGNPEAVVTGEEQRTVEGESAADAVTAVLVGVGVFAGLAVVSAVVVVGSTFRIVLTQRRTQLALLRCVGARRSQLIRAVLAEAVVTGLVAGLAGVAVAMLAGYGLLAAMRGSGVTDVPELVVSWPRLGGVLLVAVLATVVAALGPAVAAARIPPVAALGAAGAGEVGAPRSAGRLVLAGLLAAAAAGLAALGVGFSGSPFEAVITVAASGMTAFAAVIAAGPLLVRALGATAGRVVAAIGRGPGRLATANAAQVPRRTAATISVLSLGVGLTSALLVALAAVQSGAEQKIAELFPSAITVSAVDASSAEAFAARLSRDPRLVARSEDDVVLVDPATGADLAAVQATVEEAANEDGMTVAVAGDARSELENQLAIASMIGLGLVGMTLLVAVVGVGVTLMLSVTERVRETGLLRVVGLSRSGVRMMVALEAGLSGSGAAVLGVVIGAVYGALAVEALGLDYGLASVPVLQLVGLVVAVVVVAMLAAVVPAVRAGRVSPIRALQEA